MAKANETKKNIIVVEGVVTSARIGTSKFDESIKNRLSIKCDENTLPWEIIDNAYSNSGTRLTPNWVKEKNGYININSKFNIPCKDTRNKGLSFEEFTEKTTAIGSKIKISLNVKEGAIYPIAFIILEDGEEADPFANLN